MKKRNAMTTVLALSASLIISGCKYTQGEMDVAVREAYDDGYNDGFGDGYVKGDQDGFARGDAHGYNRGFQEGSSADVTTAYNNGYTAGDAAGFNRGFDQGYSQGDSAGFNRGQQQGFQQGQSVGYQNGLGVGYDMGYDDGYGDGFDDGVYISYDAGYNDGFGDGIDIGYDYGYNDGFFDGEFVGYDMGYGHGFEDGYDIGYDDGWFDAWGFSKDIGKASSSHKIAAKMLNDLIDFKSLKSPKQVVTDVETQRLMMNSTSGMTMDSKTQNAILEKYLINSMKEQLQTHYGLKEDRSLKIARLANQMIKVSGERQLSAKETNLFAQEVIGSDLVKMKEAYEKSMKGQSEELNQLIEKAAEVNGITPEHTSKIMSKLFL